jgi:selenocysteine lyase/cysteine desulfurase
LINAKPSEISYIPNTSTGENLVVECLGIGKNEGNVVTDALHFEGALIHLMELKKRGLDLRVVSPREDGRIDMRISSASSTTRRSSSKSRSCRCTTAFSTILKAVCDLAHAHGAYVLRDIIQGVGRCRSTYARQASTSPRRHATSGSWAISASASSSCVKSCSAL